MAAELCLGRSAKKKKNHKLRCHDPEHCKKLNTTVKKKKKTGHGNTVTLEIKLSKLSVQTLKVDHKCVKETLLPHFIPAHVTRDSK